MYEALEVLSLGAGGAWDDDIATPFCIQSVNIIPKSEHAMDGKTPKKTYIWYNGHDAGTGTRQIGLAIAHDKVSFVKSLLNPLITAPSGERSSGQAGIFIEPSLMFHGSSKWSGMWYIFYTKLNGVNDDLWGAKASGKNPEAILDARLLYSTWPCSYRRNVVKVIYDDNEQLLKLWGGADGSPAYYWEFKPW